MTLIFMNTNYDIRMVNFLFAVKPNDQVQNRFVQNRFEIVLPICSQ